MPANSASKSPDATFVDQMVAKAGGDPSKMSAEERAKMDAITRGGTEAILKAGPKK